MRQEFVIPICDWFLISKIFKINRYFKFTTLLVFDLINVDLGWIRNQAQTLVI